VGGVYRLGFCSSQKLIYFLKDDDISNRIYNMIPIYDMISMIPIYDMISMIPIYDMISMIPPTRVAGPGLFDWVQIHTPKNLVLDLTSI
jgi:hypothetical protein